MFLRLGACSEVHVDRVASVTRFAFLILLVSLGFSGCTSAPKDEEGNEKISTLPWNRPEKWERTAPVGGATY